MSMERIGGRELRQNASRYLALVKAGEEVEVSERGTLVAMLVPLDRAVQDLACDIGGPMLRSLAALHLASAVLLRDELTAFVAYDHRLLAAAKNAGLFATAPSHATSAGA